MWGAGMMGQVWPRLRPCLLGSLLATAALGSVLGSVLGTVVWWAQGSFVRRPRSAPCICLERQYVVVVRLLYVVVVAGTLPDEKQCRLLEQDA